MIPLLFLGLMASATAQDCPEYAEYASERHEPFSSGFRQFPFQRPSEDCRTFVVPEIESIIADDMNSSIADPDLYRLFVNTWPNTVDTTVRWTGFSADNPEEEVSDCRIACENSLVRPALTNDGRRCPYSLPSSSPATSTPCGCETAPTSCSPISPLWTMMT
jgi:hypothetical protein